MIKQLTIAAATFATFSAAGAATTPESGWYLGGSLGQSRFDADTTGFNGSTDKRDTAWNLFGGYQLNRNLGIELGYIDLGNSSFNGTLGVPIGPFPAGAGAVGSIDATAWTLAAVGTIPFTQRFSGYAKLGMNYNETTLNASVGGVSGSSSDRNTGLLAGLGLKYELTPSVGLRGGWDRYRIGDDATGGKGDVDFWSVGLQFKF
jgi:OOP family OmpA-OmpF porin